MCHYFVGNARASNNFIECYRINEYYLTALDENFVHRFAGQVFRVGREVAAQDVLLCVVRVGAFSTVDFCKDWRSVVVEIAASMRKIIRLFSIEYHSIFFTHPHMYRISSVSSVTVPPDI